MTRIDHDDKVLEQNVESLLGGAYDPPRIDERARARIREALIAAHVQEAPARRVPRYAIFAGAALAAAAGGLLAIRALRSHGGAGATIRDGKHVALADGSTAILDDGATLEVTGDRHVRIVGRALVDVVPGKGEFTVDTDNGTIHVLGTRFVVDASANETDAAVIRGLVRLASSDGEALLHAGEEGVAIKGRAPTRMPAPRLSHLASWAALERRREEGPSSAGPVRNGTLIARTTGVPMHAPWFTPDEYPLPLTSLTVDAVVDNQVARVAIDQTFHNDQPQDLEAVYRFALPSDAALSRLAMYVDGKLQESAVVERMQARRVYEDLVYHRVDPALLEWTGAGKVELRVYPVPAQQDKRIVLGYTQPLARLYDDWTLQVPLPTLDAAVGAVHMKVRVKGCALCEIHSPSHAIAVAPDGDDAVVTYERANEKTGDSLVLDVRDPSKAPRAVTKIADGFQYVMVRAQVPLSSAAQEHRARRWVILDDVSASRDALQRKAQGEVIDRLMTELDEDDQVAVMTFDVRVRQQGQLVAVRSIDRKRVHDFVARERGGVGATDLGGAITRALGVLGGGDARDNVIVYLGDGEVTDGERTLGALRDQLKGHATFVGVGIGDGADLPTLGALADATGGLTYAIDPADDLGWRAFDLVASLYTARATDLAVDVLGPDGKAIDGALAYLRNAQLGDGEELEVVARVPQGAPVARVAVRGSLGDTPWSTTIDLASAQHPAGDPGYLPRLWAQRRIAKLLLDKFDGAQACTGEPCPSADELREAHREELRKEIVALGKTYFLLSRHTSLLVLENDAMYAQYGVPRTRTTEWMPYALPATIPVPPRTTVATSTAEEAILVRTPQPYFYQQPQYWNFEQAQTWGGGGWDGDEWGGVALAGPRRADWVVHARDAGVLGELDKSAAIDQTSTSQGITLTTGANATPATSEPKMKALSQPDDDIDGRIVTTAELVGGDTGEGTIGMGSVGTIGQGAGRGAREHGRTRWNGGEGEGYGFGKSGGRYGGYAGAPSPVSMYYPTDPRLDDLTEQVPAFFPGAFDEIAADLRASVAPHAKGSIDDDAAKLVAQAREHVAPGVYKWGDGPAITVDAAGRMGWRETTDAGLEEWNSYDGQTWRRAYPELGLELARPVGDDEPALYGAILPLLVATPEHLAPWYDVRAQGRSITLTPAGTKNVSLTMDLDADGHLVAIRANGDRVTITWSGGAPTAAQVGARSFAVSYQPALVADAGAAGRPDAADLVSIELPLHTPAVWQKQLEGLTAGSDAWRHAERQLLAASAALGDQAAEWTAYQALRDHGGVTTGDVALASRGLAISTSDDEQRTALAAVPAGAKKIAEYLAASRRFGKAPKAGIFAAHAGGDLLGTLSQYREAIALVQLGQIDRAVDALAAMGDRAPTLRMVATAYLGNSWGYRSAKVVRAWDALAVGRWRNIARYEAARVAYTRGDYDGAAERYGALLADVDLAADPIPYDGMPMYAFQQSARGPAGWQLAYAAWKSKVLAGGDLAHVMTLARAAAQAQPGDLDRVLARAADLADGDGDAIAEVAGLAMQYGQADRAAALIDAARKTSPSPELDRLASVIAERQGRPAEAATLLAHALDADADAPRPLSQVRADYTRLLQLDGRVASLASAGTDREHAIGKLEDDAAAWRDLDPDYDPREQAVAAALIAAGQDDEAMRVLSTVIERHPMEGSGWGAMAETLEQQGRLDAARDAWHQAVVIDQTNPSWRVRDAQVLFALGRDDDALRELGDVVHRKWHERWTMVVEQAQQLYAREEAAHKKDRSP